MQHTNKYQLNLIEKSDPFSPDALNKNTEAIEAALIEHETTVDSRITAHETTVSAALASHKAETDSALSAHEAAMNTRVTAVEANVDAGARFIKLGYATGSASQAVAFDLSKINMNDYAALLLFSSAYGTGSTSAGLEALLYINGGTAWSIAVTGKANTTASGLTVLQPIDSYTSGLTLCGAGISNGDTGATYHTRFTNSWSGITSLSFKLNRITAAAFALYGIKK